MAELIRLKSLQQGYKDVCYAVRQRGRKVSPRGLDTWELSDVTLEIMDPVPSLPIGCGRSVRPALGAVEALQLIAGVSCPELLVQVAPNYAEFMDTPSFQYGAYGPRIAQQVPHVLGILKKDPDTRQAVMGIWTPADLLVETKDIPCTCILRYAIRDGSLHASTYMRSNDVWWGLAYDVFQFTQLQLSMARSLNVKVGGYTHSAASLHLYQRDVAKLDELKLTYTLDRQATGIGDMGEAWMIIRSRAVALLNGWALNGMSDSEQWYRAMLARYVKESA